MLRRPQYEFPDKEGTGTNYPLSYSINWLFAIRNFPERDISLVKRPLEEQHADILVRFERPLPVGLDCDREAVLLLRPPA